MPPRALTHPARPARRRADPARTVAYKALCAVSDRDAYVNLLLPTLLRDSGLTGRDAALATELAYGTLRGQGSYDAILAICSDRDLDRIDPPLRQVLRLGAHQLLATRIGAHAAVATSVDLAKDVAGPRPAGFVNAVLRKVATRDFAAWLEIAAPRRDDDLTGHLSVAYSHPRWIVDALSEALGEDPASGLAETEAVLAADGERPRVTLCAVPGLADPAELVAAGATPGQWSPFAAVLAEGDPAQIAAVAQGRAAVQDEASQLAALALARADVAGDAGPAGARWLDMCAGPGGKARLLAGLAPAGEARLLAADLRLHRAGLLRSSLAGAGAPRGAAVVAADGTAPAWRLGAFDRVLADVPCSGLGALRRRAEARWRRSPADVTALGPVQRALLAAALDSARPGGVVAYVTCSPHLAETRDVVTSVLAGRDDAEVLDAPAVLPEVPGLRCPEPHPEFAQFWPHRHGTDAIFIALLRRTA
ncbi:MAG TPA: transcription antitermination factor NusB [Streptosporangiaceae bacterium]|jgi:16S rRNA (cytosine967-C5)-methyltransferase